MSAAFPVNRVAVIGSGPIGLEAALHATRAGFEVAVFEKGEVADSVRNWGHIRLFSPFSMNASDTGREAITNAGGTLPENDDLLTGKQFYEAYLKPLSELPELAGRIHQNTGVTAIGRRWLRKGHAIGHATRQADMFDLVVRCGDEERVETANFVFDCSGSYPNHRLIGGGGQGCPGESRLPANCYQLADILGSDRPHFLGKHTFVVGGGYSAATAIVSLGELMQAEPKTSVTWLTRGDDGVPMHRAAGDPLVERDRIASTANQLVADGRVTWIREQRIVNIETGAGYRVTLETVSGDRTVYSFDQIAAHPGYRPDTSLYRELQVHECYASEGPIKLAAALLGGSGDCLIQPETGPETLKNPEPGFFVLGSKSYGRNSRFLIQAGLRQIEDVMPLIAKQLEATA
jgi:hypothetical protein